MHNKLLMDIIENVYLYTIKTLGSVLFEYTLLYCVHPCDPEVVQVKVTDTGMA